MGTTASPAIETRQLTKYYGKARGIIDLDLRVEAGEVFGFLGPNGAGKTTTIRLLMDLIHPTSGHAAVFGKDVHEESLAIKASTGYLPGELALWNNLTGRQILTYLGNLRGGVSPGAPWGVAVHQSSASRAGRCCCAHCAARTTGAVGAHRR